MAAAVAPAEEPPQNGFLVQCSTTKPGSKNILELPGTELSISGPDVPGLLACITAKLHSRGLAIHSTKGEPLPGGGIKDTFVVTRYGEPLEPQEEMSMSMELTDVANQLRDRASTKTARRSVYTVSVNDEEEAEATVLYIEGPDAPGLLGAITSTLSAASCSIKGFGGETTGDGIVRDRFVVQQEGKQPLAAGARAPLVRRLQEACRKCAEPDAKKIEACFAVSVESNAKDT